MTSFYQPGLCSRISKAAPPCGDKHSTHRPAREIPYSAVAPASLWLDEVRRMVLSVTVSLLSGGLGWLFKLSLPSLAAHRDLRLS